MKSPGKLYTIVLLLACSRSPTAGSSRGASNLISDGVEILGVHRHPAQGRVHVGPLLVESLATPAGPFDRIVARAPTVSLRHGPDLVSEPEVAMQTLFVALPLGRSATLTVAPEGSPTPLASRLYPVQPPQRSAAGPHPGDPRPVDPTGFVFDPAAYAAGATSVAQPLAFVSEVLPGTNIYRLTLALLDVDASGQASRFDSLLVDLRFEDGSPTCFKRQRVAVGASPDPVDQRLETLVSSIEASVVNGSLLDQLICVQQIVPTDPGARLIILTLPPSGPQPISWPSTDPARDQHQGGGGDRDQPLGTADGRGRARLPAAARDGWAIQPRWVLLLGDSEHLPTHYDAPNIWDSARNAGDAFYGPGVGRFPVDTAAQAQLMVDRVVAMETSPPAAASGFYARTALAAQFQDDDLDQREDRRYSEIAEDIASFLIAQGGQVNRIYTAPAGQQPHLVARRRRRPGLPAAPLFAWSGSTADVVAAFNSGPAVFLHRDHGWWVGLVGADVLHQ
jgi:hypothetical protein